VEKAIVAIWAELLDLDSSRIGLHSNFFQVGGHSLKILRMTKMINDRFHSNFSVVDFFQLPTVSAISKFIIAGQRQDDRSIDLDERDDLLSNLRDDVG
jgi:acyl carrier protein